MKKNGVQQAAQSIRALSKKTVASQGRDVQVGIVKRINPIQVELTHGAELLDEGDDVILGQGVRAIKLAVGDNLVLVDTEDNDWLAVSVLADDEQVSFTGLATPVSASDAATKAYVDSVAGAGGHTVLNGAGVPSAGLGNNGDFYINTSANTIYGPKTSGAWGSATSLVGPAGATGSTGAQGSAGATGAQGNTGLQGSTGATGAQGIQGVTGATGSQGATGSTGAVGADGKTVLNGSGVPSSGLGNNGDFYLNTSASTIYGPKTAGAWGSATSLVGATGAAGATGAQGIQGIQGTTGATGSQGATGSTGATGSAGIDGKTVLNGAGTPSAGLGVNGDFYINTSASTIYGPKASGAWGSPTSLVGSTGATGAQGIQGTTGAQGSVGATGATGAQGTQGIQGATGSAGATGSTGAAGADGKTVLNGSGAPSAGLGVNGDFYVNTAASTIYGPKASGAWGSATSLVGATGATGATAPLTPAVSARIIFLS